MKYEEQMTPTERADILLGKYKLEYIRFTVNGLIRTHTKDQNILMLNHWNEVARIIKQRLNIK
jgi:hypothetical protein